MCIEAAIHTTWGLPVTPCTAYLVLPLHIYGACLLHMASRLCALPTRTYIHTYTFCDHHSWCALSGLCRLGVYGCVLMDMHVSQTRRTCQFDDTHMYKRCHHVSNTYYLLTLGQCHVVLLLTMYHGTYRYTNCHANTSNCMLPTRCDTRALHTACSGDTRHILFP